MKHFMITITATGMTILLLATASFAGGSGNHGHHNPGHMAGMGKMGNMHNMHRHASWPDAPGKYAGKKNRDWSDTASAKRGKALFEQQCTSCHGIDGRGTGPAASALTHKPADLTHHFHAGPGKGDAYLYWRITEGGTTEPFKSQNSAMPAFSFLSEKERWDILTYVHQAFHRGFKSS